MLLKGEKASCSGKGRPVRGHADPMVMREVGWGEKSWPRRTPTGVEVGAGLTLQPPHSHMVSEGPFSSEPQFLPL